MVKIPLSVEQINCERIKHLESLRDELHNIMEE